MYTQREAWLIIDAMAAFLAVGRSSSDKATTSYQIIVTDRSASLDQPQPGRR
jgi:hypothetical protein